MGSSGKKRDEETGQGGSPLDSFTNQMKKLRASYDDSTYIRTEDTAEEADMKKRKKELEEMARRGMR